MGWFLVITTTILGWLILQRFAAAFMQLLFNLATQPETLGGKLIGLMIAAGLIWGFLRLVA